MATEKSKIETSTVKERLQSLYQLQTILSEIDRIRTVRGELPLEIKDLEDDIEGKRTRLDNIARDIAALQQTLADDDAQTKSLDAQIARYEKQCEEIRNSKEYDLLQKEINFQSLEKQQCLKRITENNRRIETKKQESVATQEALTESEQILAQKKGELDEIVSETRQDEERLRVRAKEIEPKVDERTLKAFKRIRENARNGLGIVAINRSACGGCFNRIPPQKQMEIKLHKKVIVCEYCGRIMIDPDLAAEAEGQLNGK